ncbi:MAG: fumarylacetoacetate hydrolase family protein [Hyphomonadaceae bacterium]|nr:fumarylacetoacetate hydrolase family protein [Hyphomonadaceae bacterium]
MTQAHLFEIPITAIPVAGEQRSFPVRRIFCVGRNYADHAREMGSDPRATPPFFFMKHAGAAHLAGKEMAFPADTENLHHEVELVLAIGAEGRALEAPTAEQVLYGYGVGLDLTKRDRQAEARAAGGPWERAKSFEASAPMSMIRPMHATGPLRSGRIWLSLNGEMCQAADIADMIWSPAEILTELSRLWVLQPGDLVFTGTPAGVSTILAGDRLRAGVDGVGEIDITIG